MLIHRKRNDLLNVHRDAASRCCWDSGLMLNISHLGKTVSVKCLSKLEEVFSKGGDLNYMKAHNVYHLFL